MTKKKLRDKQNQRTLDVVRAYKTIFGTADGQTVLYDLMNKGHFLKPTYDKSDTAALRNEGKRELCLYILERMALDLNKVMKIVEQETTLEEEYFN